MLSANKYIFLENNKDHQLGEHKKHPEKIQKKVYLFLKEVCKDGQVKGLQVI